MSPGTLSYKAFSSKPLTEKNDTHFIDKEIEEQITEETYLGEGSPCVTGLLTP